MGQASACHAPRAFTLVELLVVIGIIGLLAALLTPVVMQSLAKARNAAIKSEIDMLHMAMMNYQSEYGVLPPCYDSYFTSGSYTAGGEAAKHLKRIFPRCPNSDYQLNNVVNPPVRLYPSNAVVAWLSGFTTDPRNPLVPASARVRLYDFDQSRINGTTASYFPSGKPGSPFIYIDNSQYRSFIPVDQSGATISAFRVPPSNDPSNFANVNQPFFNETTFQILCAGRDEQFGTDDDLSNFWPGTRREYVDSLKD